MQMDLDDVVVNMWRDPEDGVMHIAATFPAGPEPVHLHVGDTDVIVAGDGSIETSL
jgi:hypothetical protein